MKCAPFAEIEYRRTLLQGWKIGEFLSFDYTVQPSADLLRASYCYWRLVALYVDRFFYVDGSKIATKWHLLFQSLRGHSNQR